MIEVSDLKKSYGSVKALRGVSFNISAGEIVGLLGPNGAGKTTIIKTLTGYLQPDSGSVSINELDVLNQTRQVQTNIGYLPENAPLYPELSVQNYLKMIADLREIPDDEQLIRISETVHSVGLEEFLTRPIGHLSKGYRQRVGLAQAILHRPKLLILDEPTIGLDPTQIVEIRKLIRRLSAHSTILFSTHILPEVEMLCDRVIIIMNGEIKVNSKMNELASTSNVTLVLEKDSVDAAKDIQKITGVEQIKTYQTPDGFPAFQISSQKEADISPQIYQLASKHNWPLRELRRDARTLESVFNELAVAE
ncbi:MAG: ATP-binding cassette domain-containing protein [Anaerolineaceae bacterium]|nr:ATP-binding cassette domain-containing protein [Anaerolineaceae bacterium]